MTRPLRSSPLRTNQKESAWMDKTHIFTLVGCLALFYNSQQSQVTKTGGLTSSWNLGLFFFFLKKMEFGSHSVWFGE